MPISPQNIAALAQHYRRQRDEGPGQNPAAGGNIAGQLKGAIASTFSPNTGQQFNPASETNAARLGEPRQVSEGDPAAVMYKEF